MILRSVLMSVLMLIAPMSSATSQQACQEIEAVVLQCPDGHGIAGDPPACFCNGSLVENLELSCAINIGCATGDEIGTGTWPDCACRPREEIMDLGGDGAGGSGDGTGVGGGLGGASTCEQFFECPTGFDMGVQGDQCVCEQVMLPQF